MGPTSVRFDVDCLHTVFYTNTTVFGSAEMPSAYASFPPGVTVRSCFARVPNVAILEVDAGLLAGRAYALRIGLAENPLMTPSPNQWSIAFQDQASLPFDGFTLWTFTDTSISASTTAISVASGQNRKENLVALTLRPFSSVEPDQTSGGRLTIEAPPGYDMKAMNGECRTEFFEQNFYAADQEEGEQWGDSDFTCRVEKEIPNMLFLDFQTKRALTAGTLYRLVLRVLNPNEMLEPGFWRIATFGPPLPGSEQGVPLDDVVIPGFMLNPMSSIWTVSNQENVVHGSAKVDRLHFSFAFPDDMFEGDLVTLIAPLGFELSQDGTSCRNFRWDPQFSWDPMNNNMRSCSFCSCHDRVMEMKIDKYQSSAFEVKFLLTTENLPRTPALTDNVWTLIHQRGADYDACRERHWTCDILSSDTAPGWVIIPQLEDVSVTLTGLFKAAGSYSELIVNFVPVSPADKFTLLVETPDGFDFTWVER